MSRHLFIAGAQRSGTTYLYRILDSHPDIDMNKPWWPEPKFFLKDDSHLHVDEYLKKYFSPEAKKIRGDKSASYMESEIAASCISQCFPDARIIFTLRDPIERAISNYWYTVAHKLEDRPIDEALSTDADRPYVHIGTSVSPFAYLQRSKYINYIEMYQKYFDKSQLKVLIFEQVVGNRQAIKNLFEFLDVEPNFLPPSLNEKVNEYGAPEGALGISAKTESFLRDYFRESNQKLVDKFGVEISKWRAGNPLSV